ncbi:hypothetical protein Pla144_50020 [Bythopirellula polymerisocia]|uniref:Uncharacterized protein n=1 Tax=Bythopirellula polymerisocia TaxID=2528003 RepID=A0A5C6C8D0_9BACT|nr:hypothetical protein Pla144_50020 [Bythopirellula polymerisocia]
MSCLSAARRRTGTDSESSGWKRVPATNPYADITHLFSALLTARRRQTMPIRCAQCANPHAEHCPRCALLARSAGSSTSQFNKVQITCPGRGWHIEKSYQEPGNTVQTLIDSTLFLAEVNLTAARYGRRLGASACQTPKLSRGYRKSKNPPYLYANLSRPMKPKLPSELSLPRRSVDRRHLTIARVIELVLCVSSSSSLFMVR